MCFNCTMLARWYSWVVYLIVHGYATKSGPVFWNTKSCIIDLEKTVGFFFLFFFLCKTVNVSWERTAKFHVKINGNTYLLDFYSSNTYPWLKQRFEEFFILRTAFLMSSKLSNNGLYMEHWNIHFAVHAMRE